MTDLTSPHANSWIVETWSQGVESSETNRPETAAVQEEVELQAGTILRTLTQMMRCSDPEEAGRLLASRLQQFLGCRQIAVGLCRVANKRCRIRGLSGVVRFDSHSRLVGAIQDALEETVVHESETRWPAPEKGERHPALAHERLASILGASCVASIPFRNADGGVIGAVLLVGEPATGALELLRRYLPALTACLEILERDRRGLVRRTARQLRAKLATWRGRVMCVAAAALILLLLVPGPYQVSCHCQVQPVTRRFVVAPYDGVLDKSLVSPGDVVKAGDVLARMGEQEIRWEMASLEADLARATKERDAAMASQRVSAAQLAELEMERLDVRARLLDHRLSNLAVRSPIDGIVVAGDLEKAEGAPLAIGQTLFEVAPLQRMTFEVHVPEEDISYVAAGMPVTVTLDAFASEPIRGILARIHPRAELQEHESVFVAQFEWENPQGRLRPGMNGWAEVTSGRKRLGWILFHKPWNGLRRALAW